ncbi:MAG: hypothetical protein E6R13_01085 [Spirochaetes bacterium]|nr:MAG: hypothetical protein E6R13_01085 [Spirochaetota bacterium]
MKDESKCISTEEKLTHKLWELKVLSLFMKQVTVNNIEVSLAFGSNSFRYWHGTTIVDFNFSKSEDIDKFLLTEFLVVVGDVEV